MSEPVGTPFLDDNVDLNSGVSLSLPSHRPTWKLFRRPFGGKQTKLGTLQSAFMSLGGRVIKKCEGVLLGNPLVDILICVRGFSVQTVETPPSCPPPGRLATEVPGIAPALRVGEAVDLALDSKPQLPARNGSKATRMARTASIFLRTVLPVLSQV